MNIINILTISLSALAIIISFLSYNTSRKYNKLSLRPYLTFFANSSDNGRALQILLMNKGVGPGRIVSMDMTYKGEKVDVNKAPSIQKKIDEQVHNFASKYGLDIPINRGILQIKEGQTIVAKDEKISFLHIQSPNKDLNAFVLEGIVIDLKYASVHEDTYTEHFNTFLIKNKQA